jgi:hypothetical protein
MVGLVVWVDFLGTLLLAAVIYGLRMVGGVSMLIVSDLRAVECWFFNEWRFADFWRVRRG